MSIGITVETNKFKELYAAGARNFTIDIAHGHSMPVIQIIRAIKSFDPKCVVMAGNVCTGEGFSDLAEAGADIVKVGVGPGAACTTRIMTGVGVPQFSAIVDCAAAKARLKSRGIECCLVADGGIKYPRDACLAIAAGADAVMMGSGFARTYESAAKKQSAMGAYTGGTVDRLHPNLWKNFLATGDFANQKASHLMWKSNNRPMMYLIIMKAGCVLQ